MTFKQFGLLPHFTLAAAMVLATFTSAAARQEKTGSTGKPPENDSSVDFKINFCDQAWMFYQIAQDRDPPRKIFAFIDVLESLTKAGYDVRTEKPYQEVLRTTKADFEKISDLKGWAKTYYKGAHDPQESCIQALTWLVNMENMLRAMKYDFEMPEPYQFLGTSKVDYQTFKKDLQIASARHHFQRVIEDKKTIDNAESIEDLEKRNPREDLNSAWVLLKQAGLDLTKNETWALIGTTQAGFQQLEEKYCPPEERSTYTPPRQPTLSPAP